MINKTLLSIGKLSKLTGVHIKSLRYYDRLGILHPVYVEPNSKFRYYTFQQVYLVEAIQLCVELDIPLKRFTDFLADGHHKIAYDKLLSFGAKLANEKIMAIQDKLAFLEKGMRMIEDSDSYAASDGIRMRTLPALDCICVPIQGKPGMERCYDLIGDLYVRMHNEGLRHGAESGLLSRYHDNEVEHFAFIETVVPEATGIQITGLLHLPAMTYAATIIDDSDGILQAPIIFSEQFGLPTDRIVIQTDLFRSVEDITAPKYELRCTL